MSEKTAPEDTVRLGKLMAASKMFDALMRVQTQKNNCRSAYTPLLFALSHKDGMLQQELAQITRLSAPTISITIKNMLSDGFITKIRDAEDGRSVHIWLTDKGREMNAKMRESVLLIEEICLDGVTAKELKQLDRLLEKLLSNLEKEVGTEFSYE